MNKTSEHRQGTCKYCLETIEQSNIDPSVWWDWQGTAYCEDNPEGELGQHQIGEVAPVVATTAAPAANVDVDDSRDWDYELGITDTPKC